MELIEGSSIWTYVSFVSCTNLNAPVFHLIIVKRENNINDYNNTNNVFQSKDHF
jgi:hypothetical protein